MSSGLNLYALFAMQQKLLTFLKAGLLVVAVQNLWCSDLTFKFLFYWISSSIYSPKKLGTNKNNAYRGAAITQSSHTWLMFIFHDFCQRIKNGWLWPYGVREGCLQHSTRMAFAFISSLQIEHMKQDMGQKFLEGQEKLSQVWLQLFKANPEAKDGAKSEVWLCMGV